MEANHPNLTNQKTLYVEISRARDRAELVTDDAGALRERLEAATGERVSALEGTGEAAREAPAKGPEVDAKADRAADREDRTGARETGRAGSSVYDCRLWSEAGRGEQTGRSRMTTGANVPETVRFQAESAPRSPLGLMPCLSKFDFSRSFTFLVHPHAPCRAPRRFTS